MNLENISQRPQKVESSLPEVTPTVNEMLRDKKTVETYAEILISSLRSSNAKIDKLLSEQVGSTGKTKADGLRDLLLMTIPARLKCTEPGDDEKLREGLDKFLKNQIKKYEN